MPDRRNEENTAVACHCGTNDGEEQKAFKVPLDPSSAFPRQASERAIHWWRWIGVTGKKRLAPLVLGSQ